MFRVIEVWKVSRESCKIKNIINNFHKTVCNNLLSLLQHLNNQSVWRFFRKFPGYQPCSLKLYNRCTLDHPYKKNHWEPIVHRKLKMRRKSIRLQKMLISQKLIIILLEKSFELTLFYPFPILEINNSISCVGADLLLTRNQISKCDLVSLNC